MAKTIWWVATYRNDVSGDEHRACTETTSRREARIALALIGHSIIDLRPGTIWDV